MKDSIPEVMIRPATLDDKDQIVNLLGFLPNQYPEADEWLERRLTEAFNGNAYAFCLFHSGELVGILLGILKPNNKMKISTFYITPEHSGLGLGKILLAAGVATAILEKASAVYLTANARLEKTLGGLLENQGFKLIAAKPDLYIIGDTENIYELTL